jgi:AraC-like DNA-binding protein
MTFFPKYLTDFPNKDSVLPLHISVNRIERAFDSHRHDFLEFSYVLSGSGTESINGVIHPMEPGTFTFVLPYQFHEIHASPGSPLILVNCMFGINIFMEIGLDSGLSRLLDEAEHGLPPFYCFTGEDEARMRNKLSELIDEYKGSQLWRSTMLKSGLAEVLIRFDRLRNDAIAQSAEPNSGTPKAVVSSLPSGAPKERQIGKVVHHLHTHYREPLALHALAEHYQVSPSYFSEWFKRSTGQTFLHFLHDVRLRHGCALLTTTDLSITEIALEIGYGSYKTFTRIFQDKKGITPSEYRKRQYALARA